MRWVAAIALVTLYLSGCASRCDQECQELKAGLAHEQ
jgi:outer membrane murein-binding lipoprotein Lpp